MDQHGTRHQDKFIIPLILVHWMTISHHTHKFGQCWVLLFQHNTICLDLPPNKTLWFGTMLILWNLHKSPLKLVSKSSTKSDLVFLFPCVGACLYTCFVSLGTAENELISSRPPAYLYISVKIAAADFPLFTLHTVYLLTRHHMWLVLIRILSLAMLAIFPWFPSIDTRSRQFVLSML